MRNILGPAALVVVLIEPPIAPVIEALAAR
jgi:hypothetical protein